MSRTVAASSGVALAALIALTAVAGTPLLLAALLLGVVAVASGWATLLALPTPRGSTTVVALGGAVALCVAALTAEPPRLRWLPGVLALTLLAEFGHQLFRRDMRPRLIESVTGVVSGVVVVAFGAGWLGAARSVDGTSLVVCGAAGVAAACAATGLPWPQRTTAPVALVAGAGAAALAAGFAEGVEALPAAVLGLGLATVVATTDRLLAHLPTAGRLTAAVARGAAPVTGSGLVVYTLGRLVT